MPQYKNVPVYKNQDIIPNKTIYKNQDIIGNKTIYQNQDIIDSKTIYKNLRILPDPGLSMVEPHAFQESLPPTNPFAPTNRIHQSHMGQERLLRSMDQHYKGEDVPSKAFK